MIRSVFFIEVTYSSSKSRNDLQYVSIFEEALQKMFWSMLPSISIFRLSTTLTKKVVLY